ncbi:MAG: hypothetical protein AVDCRST_MAG64-4481, partial [uncultured Phycisphaerae bacterium]
DRPPHPHVPGAPAGGPEPRRGDDQPGDRRDAADRLGGGVPRVGVGRAEQRRVRPRQPGRPRQPAPDPHPRAARVGPARLRRALGPPDHRARAGADGGQGRDLPVRAREPAARAGHERRRDRPRLRAGEQRVGHAVRGRARHGLHERAVRRQRHRDDPRAGRRQRRPALRRRRPPPEPPVRPAADDRADAV